MKRVFYNIGCFIGACSFFLYYITNIFFDYSIEYRSISLGMIGEFILGFVFLFSYYTASNIHRSNMDWQKVAGFYLIFLGVVDIAQFSYGKILNIIASILILIIFYKRNLIFRKMRE